MERYALVLTSSGFVVTLYETWFENQSMGSVVDTSSNRQALEDEADQRNYEREQQLEFDLYDYNF
jgi:hypothetical protein